MLQLSPVKSESYSISGHLLTMVVMTSVFGLGPKVVFSFRGICKPEHFRVVRCTKRYFVNTRTVHLSLQFYSLTPASRTTRSSRIQA